MATTSGTVGTVQTDVTTLVEHSFRRCGKLPSTVSSEQQLGARESLGFLLTDLVNEGISLWCIQTACIPFQAGVTTYAMPPGTCDLLSANYRSYATLTGSTISGAGYSGLFFTSQTSPTNVQIQFTAAGTPALVVEYSQDNVTWYQTAAFALQQTTLAAGTPIAQDIANSVPAYYWRVRDTSGTMLAGATLIWSNVPSEILMAPLNRDDYWVLPNKSFTALNPLQYWYDKQITPQVWVWPVPNSGSVQMVVHYQRQIEDVGEFTDILEVPQRWLEYVIFSLSCKVALEIPPAELPPGRLEYLEAKRMESLDRAANGESDGSPIKLQPVLRGYTGRG